MTVRTASSVLGLVVLAYIGVFVWFSPLLLQDLPNHLARAVIMADLLFRQGESFGQDFQLHFLFVPYLLGDLLLAALVQTVGVTAAAIIWPTLTFLSLPCALLVYLRSKNASAEVTFLMLLISLYLSTDTFFAMGFFSFKLSLALALVALMLVELLRQRWRLVYFVAFIAVVVIAFLVHLVAVGFIAAMIVASALLRRVYDGSTRLDREAYLLAPVVGLLGWYVLSAAAHRHPTDEVTAQLYWGTLARKLVLLKWDFVRYDLHLDRRFGVAFITLILVCLPARRISWKEAIRSLHVLEPAVYAAMFVALYFVFPSDYSEASYVDVRALPFATLFGSLALLSLPQRGSSPRQLSAPAIWLTAAFVCANLVYLGNNYRTYAQWLVQYRAIIANIPERATVLPIETRRHRENVYVELHAGSFALIDRRAMIPYLFSGNRGNPMRYFRYAHHLPAPTELWYDKRIDASVDWTQVSRQYPYILVTKPFDPSRIRVKTRTVAENDAAALLQVE